MSAEAAKFAPARRQVHLDFHNSADMVNLADAFDPNQFAETLATSGVQSVNVFAKCHHGFSYYPTEVGTIHPALGRDLLGEQITALHKRGIRAPVYLSVLWDDLAGQQNPGWVITNRAGQTLMRRPLSHDSPSLGQVGWTTLDVSSGYGDYVQSQVTELCQKYPIDGFWFDIVWPQPNFSGWGLDRMDRAGINANDPTEVYEFARQNVLCFMRRTEQTIRAITRSSSIFFNGSAGLDAADTLQFQSHLEVESLPTSGAQWGYMHYPVIARFARTLGVEFVGMTGRFHKSWADFGGLKTRDQLLYECATIIAAGGSVSIGDQLDPSGVLDAAVYRRVKQVYTWAEELEPWIAGYRPVAELAIIAARDQPAEGGTGFAERPRLSAEVEGTAQVLLELGYQFDIVDPEHADFHRYKAVIVPDGFQGSARCLARLRDARANGVPLILSGKALFDDATHEFKIDGMPVTYVGIAPTQPSYFRIDDAEEVNDGVAPDYDYVFYDPAHIVAVDPDAATFGTLKRARFTRSWQHLTSHEHAPIGETLSAPVCAYSKQTLYLAVPVFGAYHRHEYWVYRSIAQRALQTIVGRADLEYSGPSWVEASLHQAAHGDGTPRQVIHLVAYQSRRSANPVPRVDEAYPLASTQVSLRRASAPRTVYMAPSRAPLRFEYADGRVTIEIPPFKIHAVIGVE